jgi:hypothetical protein
MTWVRYPKEMYHTYNVNNVVNALHFSVLDRSSVCLVRVIFVSTLKRKH